MSESNYNEFKYSRYKKPKRNMKFKIFLTLVGLAVLCLAGNLVFQWIDKTPKSSSHVEIKSLTFYTTQSESFTKKSDAITRAGELKRMGGSAYLIVNGNYWNVINDICHEKHCDDCIAVTTRKSTIKPLAPEHKDLLQALSATFATTFDTLCKFTHEYKQSTITTREITNKARTAYNNLVDLMGEFEKFQDQNWSDQYTALHKYLNHQLFGLSLIWLEGGSENFLHVLKNATAWVGFALHDLAKSL